MAKKNKDGSLDVSGSKTKSVAAKAKLKSTLKPTKLPMKAQLMSNVRGQSASEYSKEKLFTYGSYVVEERAVPDYRDGLKPVHRAVLWSSVDLNLRPSGPYKKAARTVGDAIGKYHPHGDGSLYGAMVGIANTNPPIIDGQGNWGSPVSSFAAYRYTESKISKFAHLFMVDTSYLKVVPYVPNFSNDFTIPLYVPALLPFLLFSGQTPAPAYGVRCGNPSFTIGSVAKVVIALLKGKDLSCKSIAKKLEINHTYGCGITSELTAEDISTGKHRVEYGPILDVDDRNKVISVRSYVPSRLDTLDRIDKVRTSILGIDGVKNAYYKPGKKTKGAGPYGAMISIECKKTLSDTEFDGIVGKVDKQLRGSIPYRLGITVRREDKPNTFKYLGYKHFLKAWIKYRINLETRLIDHLLVTVERNLFVNETYLLAVKRIKELLKLLPKVLQSKDPDKALSKAMSITLEQAKIILDRQVRQLSKMEAAPLEAKVKALKQERKQLLLDKKDPGLRAARDTKERVAKYLKNPDVSKSGVPIV